MSTETTLVLFMTLCMLFVVTLVYAVIHVGDRRKTRFRKLLVIQDKEFENFYHVYSVVFFPIPVWTKMRSYKSSNDGDENLDSAIDYIADIESKQYKSLFKRIMNTQQDINRRKLIKFQEREIKRLKKLQEQTKDWVDTPSLIAKGESNV